MRRIADTIDAASDGRTVTPELSISRTVAVHSRTRWRRDHSVGIIRPRICPIDRNGVCDDDPTVRPVRRWSRLLARHAGGSLVYTAGMIGFDGTTATVPEDLEDELRLLFSNLADVLKQMGTSFEHVVEQTSFLVGDPTVVYPVFEKVRADAFAGHPPASTSVFVEALVVPDAHCEVKLVAVVPD